MRLSAPHLTAPRGEKARGIKDSQELNVSMGIPGKETQKETLDFHSPPAEIKLS